MISHEAEWKLKKIPPKQTTKDKGKDRKCKMDFFFPWDSVDIKALEGCIWEKAKG